jgi:nitrogen fixation NifU-like protein
MDELSDLYQQLILDHNRRPRNRRRMEDPTARAEGYNPLCGDRVTVYLHVEDGVVTDASFEGSGCAISTATASLMTQAIRGRTVAEARQMFERFHRMLTSDPATASLEEASAGLGKLAALGGVRRFPARVKCATLAWHTLEAALQQRPEVVSTE